MSDLAGLANQLAADFAARSSRRAKREMRRVEMRITAALFGLVALIFLSLGFFFFLSAAVGPVWAGVILAGIWALMAGIAMVLALAVPQEPSPVLPVSELTEVAHLIGNSAKSAAPALAAAAFAAGLASARR